MKKFVMLAAAVAALSGVLAGCANEPDPNETGAVVKGEPAGGAPADAKRPSNPFANAPAGMGGPAGGKGGMKGGMGGAPTPGAPGAPAPTGQ
ncbi:MAG: hypothetical protein ACOVP2_10195 [Armatimonadaceae bacterium]